MCISGITGTAAILKHFFFAEFAPINLNIHVKFQNFLRFFHNVAV